MASPVSEFLAGVGLLARGLSHVARRPRLFGLGAIPPLIMSLVFTALLVGLVVNLPAAAAALTPFADGWSQTVSAALRSLVAVALVVGSVVVMVVSFTTVTLALGSPIYDKISEHTDREFEPGLIPPEEPVARGVARAVRQSLALIGISLLVAPLIFLVGLVPVAGQVLGPVLSACFGGWMICLELLGSTFERRGLVTLAERRVAMRRHRARALGFGVPVFVLSAIPFLGVVVFPVATAGGTLLGRELLGAPDATR